MWYLGCQYHIVCYCACWLLLGQTLFDEWFIAIYNVIYTSTPVLVLGLLEQVLTFTAVEIWLVITYRLMNINISSIFHMFGCMMHGVHCIDACGLLLSMPCSMVYVGHKSTVSPAKTAEPIVSWFGDRLAWARRTMYWNHVQTSRSPTVMVTFKGDMCQPIVKYVTKLCALWRCSLFA